MKRNEILGEHKKGTKAIKYNKKPKDHTAEFSKAKEKLKPVKPMEGYNPNSAGAEHRRKLDQSHAADLKARAEGPDATERDQQRYQNYLDKKERMANDYNDRMEREDIEQEALYRQRGSSSAYDRDKRSSETGFDRPHDHRGLDQELAHETNNYAVAINGRTWKVFASKNRAEAVARSLQNKGKEATVHATGSEPTAEATGAEVGKITKVDPNTKKATLTKPDGSSMEVDSTALKPTPDGKMSIDVPDTDELKMGTNVVSTEGTEAGELTERGPVTAHPDYEDANSSFGQVQSMMGADRMQVPSMGPFAGKITAVTRTGEIVGLWADGAWKGGKALDKFRPTSEPAANTGDSTPFVPKDYQTREPLKKGPDGKWRNSKGEERDSMHGGPVIDGAAQFRSLTPRPPTQESTELAAMLRIAGLR